MGSLRVGVVGGLGLMASPMAVHWRNRAEVRVCAVHDRGGTSERAVRNRRRWHDAGVPLVETLSTVVADADGLVDGVFVCVGKNGDDAPLIGELARRLESKGPKQRFICHLSTVSNRFAEVATAYCLGKGVRYVNYPLTGGPAGAEKGTMLILGSGPRALFDELTPALGLLGKPRHFGERPDAGADVKFIGHLLVFNGLIGVSSALALESECFRGGKMGGAEQADFFDFLNQGAGGTKQWEVIASNGIRHDIWDAPFFARFALVDALYVAERCQARGVSDFTVQGLFRLVRAFAELIALRGMDIATHGLARELLARGGIHEGGGSYTLPEVVGALPEAIRRQVQLDVSEASFAGA